MVLSSQPLVEQLSKELQMARHKGWLAGVALRIGCGAPQRNPFDAESLEYLEWDLGFEEGYAG